MIGFVSLWRLTCPRVSYTLTKSDKKENRLPTSAYKRKTIISLQALEVLFRFVENKEK